MGGSADYYVLLNIPRSAGLDEIRQAFRRLARACHPDVTQSREEHERFRRAREAYEVLRDERARREYDRRLAAAEAVASGPEPLAEASRGRRRRRAPDSGRMRFDPGGPADEDLTEVLAAIFGSGLGGGLWPGAGAAGGLRPGPGPGPAGIRGARSVRRLDLDVVLTPEEALRGAEVPFRYPLGARVLEWRLAIPAGVRAGEWLEFRVPLVDGVWLRLVAHLEVGPS